MTERQRRVVHVVGEHGEVVAHVRDRVRVVVDALVGCFIERVEDDPLRVGERPDEIDDGRHRDAAPLGDSRPPLDAEVLGYLLVVG
jgi:hypothetical protein